MGRIVRAFWDLVVALVVLAFVLFSVVLPALIAVALGVFIWRLFG